MAMAVLLAARRASITDWRIKLACTVHAVACVMVMVTWLVDGGDGEPVGYGKKVLDRNTLL